jgi:uncharacterized protein (TIGR02996 family)
MAVIRARPELLAFLSDIKENPFDDGVRLILADWLEDFGNEDDHIHAELLRAQIQYHQLPQSDPAKNEARRRGRHLLQSHGKRLLGGLLEFVDTWMAERGMWSLGVNARAFENRKFRELQPSEEWAWVEELTIAAATTNTIELAAQEQFLSTISSLAFRRTSLDIAALRVLGDVLATTRIARLDLSGVSLQAIPLQQFVKPMPHLVHLDLSNVHLDESTAPVVAMLPCPNLRVLRLWGNGLGDQGLENLLRASWIANLEALDLQNAQIGWEGAEAIARAECWRNLRELNLAENRIGDVGAAALWSVKTFDRLEKLVLWGNELHEGAVGRLRERFGAKVHVAVRRN